MFDRQRNGGTDVLPEPRVDGPGIAATQHYVGAATGQVLEHAEVLGDLDRIVGGDQCRRRRQNDALGLRGDVSQQRGRRRRHEGRVVMLAGGEDIQADLFDFLRDGYGRTDPISFRRCNAGCRVRCDVSYGEDP